jgi:hypothetical protein
MQGLPSLPNLLEALFQLALQPIGRVRLRAPAVIERFRAVAPRYREVCDALLGARPGSEPVTRGYDWGSWAAGVRKSFSGGVPIDFLANPILGRTMVYAHRRGIRIARYRIGVVREMFGDAIAAELLREDPIGRPAIASLRHLTSPTRAHHAAHLAEYRRATGRDFWSSPHVAEWGGGYGDTARLIRRMNRQATYTIIDLPELCALQYVYLASLEGEDAVHVVDGAAPELRAGVVNLVSTHDFERVRAHLRPSAFISTWALTESPAAAQEAIGAANFLDAEHVLIASYRDANNLLCDRIESLALRCVPVPTQAELGPGNEYWFR